MHRPEPAMRPGILRGFRRRLGIRVHLADREVTEHEPQPAAEVLLHQEHTGMRGSTMRTFVVAVLDERNQCIHWPTNAVTRRD